MSLGQFSKVKYAPELKLRAAAELELRRRRADGAGGVAVPTFRGAALALQSSQAHHEVCIAGPSECLAGETLIYNPLTGQHTPIAELCALGKPIAVLTVFGPRQASVPFLKGVAPLYRVQMESGRSFLATALHRVLTDRGWLYVADLVAGLSVPSSSPILQASISGDDLAEFQPSVRRLSRIPLGCQDRYSAYSHSCLCDEQPLAVEDSDLAFVPSRADVLSHSRVGHSGDDQDALSGHSRPGRLSDRHASAGYSPERANVSDRLFYVSLGRQTPCDALSRYDVLFQSVTAHRLPIAERYRYGDSTRRPLPRSTSHPDGEARSAPAALIGQSLAPSWQYSACGRIPDEQVPADRLLSTLFPSDTSHKCSSALHYTVRMDTVSSITYERTDAFYDMTVPDGAHYYAGGYWHHNTGKTYAALWYLDSLLRAHKNAQAVIVRKVRVTLYGSALQTYQKIIDMRGGVTPYGGKTPEWYDYDNGSRLWVAGMDNPGKALSSERDFVYENQAEELEEADHETLTTRATGRAANAPFAQLIIDCNPGPEDHWIVQRRDAGHLHFLQSRHEDNPTLFDEHGRMTERGRLTMETLDKLTGARYWRLRMGLWVGAEGQHFEAWDESKHVIAPREITGDWVLWGSLDYGYGHPFASGILGLDPMGNTHLMAEWGARKTLIPDHVDGYLAQLARLRIHPSRLRGIAAGHDAWATRGGDDADTIADKWERAVYQRLGYPALRLDRAVVDRVNGAAALQEGFGNATRPPTLFIWQGCTETIKTIPRMVTDPKNPEDVKKINADAQGRGGDDYYDQLRYGVMAIRHTLTPPDDTQEDDDDILDPSHAWASPY